MPIGGQVVYVGPELIFKGLRGTLVEQEDRATRERSLYFQSESNGIRALPCRIEDVEPVEAVV